MLTVKAKIPRRANYSPVMPREERRQLRQLLENLPVPVDVWVMGEQEFEETKEVIGGLAYPAHKFGIVLNEIGPVPKGEL